MRNCLVGLLLLLLVLGNGYALYEIQRLKAEVAELRPQVQAAPPASAAPESLPDLANAALEALRRGDHAAAGRALDRFSAQVSEMRTLAETRRQELQKAAAQAKQAVAGKQREAEAALQRLLRQVSPPPKQGGHGVKK